MRRLTIPTAVALAFGLLTLPWAPPMSAQEQEPEAEQPLVDATAEQVGESAASLLARLDAIRADFRSYQGRLAVASAEDSLVLRIQVANSRNRFMESIQELAEIVVAEGQDSVPEGFRDQVEAVFHQITPAIWELIDELRAEIDGVRAQRPGTAPADHAALEDQVGVLTRQLDDLYTFGWDHLQSLATLEQDTEGPRRAFSSLLNARADELSGRLELSTRRISELVGRLRDTPADPDATALLVATRRNVEVNAASQRIVLNLMEDMELPTAGYRAGLVTATRDLTSGLTDAGTAITLITQTWKSFSDWLADTGPDLFVKLLIIVLILVGGRFLALLTQRVVERNIDKANLDISRLLRRKIINTTRTVIMVLALLIALRQLGISLAPMLAGLGVVGFILGFAMQDSLSNLAAGMMILINRPYDKGDLVEIGGFLGRVEHMSLVSTKLLTLDNQRLEVPNTRVWGDIIKNVTDQKLRRVDLVFGISYSDDIPHAERVLNEILAENELILDDPEPMVRVHALGESSVDFVVRPWVKTDDYWDVHWDVTKKVKMRFDEEGIGIPFPQRDVHLYETKPSRQSETV